MKFGLFRWVSKTFKNFSALSTPFILGSFVVFYFIISVLIYYAEISEASGNIKSIEDGLWWGVVTFLTVGYGDRFPVTGLGRLLGVFMMMGGVLVVSLITATISAKFFEAALNKRRGEVDSETLSDHYIVCGWTDDMEDLLLHILDFNPELNSEHIVVIASLTDSQRDALLSHPQLKDLGIIQGDYYTEQNLRRAAPEKSKKVLILADRSPSHTGQAPTMVEVDARTIMTAMTLSKVSKGTLVAAEILDPKMDQYLKIAGVTEIIYSREYSRLLLGNASGGTGVVNILYDLLTPSTPAQISTQPLSPAFFNKPYPEVKAHLESTIKGVAVIGVLENVGNQHTIKETALRRAQQTPDISKLVVNLKQVKDIRCNFPVFNPSNDYLVQEGSLLITIENRERREHGRSKSEVAA